MKLAVSVLALLLLVGCATPRTDTERKIANGANSQPVKFYNDAMINYLVLTDFHPMGSR